MTDPSPAHRKGANGEDCPACGPDLLYPWICPGDSPQVAPVPDAEVDEPADTTLDPLVALRLDLTAEVEVGTDGAWARVQVAPTTSAHTRTITVYIDPDSSALIVEVDGPFEDDADDNQELRVYVNDRAVFESRPIT